MLSDNTAFLSKSRGGEEGKCYISKKKKKGKHLVRGIIKGLMGELSLTWVVSHLGGRRGHQWKNGRICNEGKREINWRGNFG